MLERKTRGSHEFVCIVLSCVDPTSSPLGSAGALEMAARARSALRGRSTWPFELARLRQGARNCPAWLLENIAPVDVSSFEPARLRWGARHSRSSPLGPAGAPEIAARARSAPLDRRRFTGQDRECLLHSTQRRTFSCMECTRRLGGNTGSQPIHLNKAGPRPYWYFKGKTTK